MNKTEKKMIQAYWQTTGGILIDSFFIATTENGEGITADALIILPLGQDMESDSNAISGRDVVALYAAEGSPSTCFAPNARNAWNGRLHAQG